MNPVVIPASVPVSEEVVRRFEKEGEDFLDSIVTGEVSWAHHERSNSLNNNGAIRRLSSSILCQPGSSCATVFWDRKKVLLVDFMPRETTINADRYGQTPQKLRYAIKIKRPGMLTKGVLFHHDNTRPHTVNQTQELIAKFG